MNKMLPNLADRAIFNLGFRIFFASAAVYAVISMALWLFVYRGGVFSTHMNIAPQYWHGHEMVFGYSMAVVAGFLLTAVGNWTGKTMPSGQRLYLIWLPWVFARIIFIVLPQFLWLGILADIVFTILFLISITKPVIKTKQWRQMGIVSKIILMLIANLFCLAATLGWHIGWYYALYLGVFVIIGLVLTIGRRVTPFFISRGVGYAFEPRNNHYIDRISLISFVIFFLLEVFTSQQLLASLCALVCALVQAWRLQGWYTQGIWKKPLLWSMFISMGCIVFGQLMYFLRIFQFGITNSLAMHMMAVGGIGILSLSMMARVSLGHSGRSIHQPPKTVPWAIGLLSVATVFRVILPWLMPQHLAIWIIHAQILWLIAFFLLSVSYMNIWRTPRVDGRAG